MLQISKDILKYKCSAGRGLQIGNRAAFLVDSRSSSAPSGSLELPRPPVRPHPAGPVLASPIQYPPIPSLLPCCISTPLPEVMLVLARLMSTPTLEAPASGLTQPPVSNRAKFSYILASVSFQDS